jgi:ribosomal protein S18 acetylase RimI-like enzyme
VIVVEEGGIIGFAHAIGKGEIGTLLRLYVDSNRRNRGVGTRLLDRTCETLAIEGCSRIEAMVLEENELGNAFYRECGFSPERESETTIGEETHDEVVYALTI